MKNHIPNKLACAIRCSLIAGAASTAVMVNTAIAEEDTENIERIQVTGSKITAIGLESSSPIQTVTAEEIGMAQEPEVEKILRDLPSTIPGDGGNVNNGTAGAATVNLRGLGPQRNLVLLNGKRMVPFNIGGRVDTASIPTAMIESVDIVTGGASAVYGSDAISGAVNFILKRDFSGVAVDTNISETADSDGQNNYIAITLGGNFDDGDGNAVMSFGYVKRDPVLLADRPLGQFGIRTDNGAGYQEFLDGATAPAPISGCGGPSVVDISGSGSTTSIPTRFEVLGTPIGLQFRDDGSLGAPCSRFNFNPFNYYQTPLERYNFMAQSHYTINDDIEAFGNFHFTNATVTQQVAPSGTFGASLVLPLYNPLISSSALTTMLSEANAARVGGTLVAGQNWTDSNANGVVDSEDLLNVRLRRRTLELGERSTSYESDLWQGTVGIRGTLLDNYDYELFYQYGESNRLNVSSGYTNLTNIQNALMATTNENGDIVCENGEAACVPINLFGGFGSITPEMAAYASATALLKETYEQEIFGGFISGELEFATLPTASRGLSLGLGFEKRTESGSFEPDECWKQAPASCLGGAGGNILPISGGYDVTEWYFEGMLPLVEDVTLIESMNLEFGYRAADYSSFGSNDAWKVGLNWRPIESVLFRVMEQRATRAPNIGELFSPVTRGLGDATIDPCSVANAGNIDARLKELCMATGMTAAQVGVIPDIIAGQVNTFDGSDPDNLPKPETADTFTAGIVLTPELPFADSFSLSIDYYDIRIEDVIGSFSPQEIIDGCYVLGDLTQCAKINRQGGDLTGDLAGIDTFVTNLDYLKAEGIEVGYNLTYELDSWGELQLNGNVNKYLTQESQSSAATPVVDCNGFFGTSCNPISDIKATTRLTWAWDDLTTSVLWRYQGAIDVLPNEAENMFEPFRHIGSYSYIDLFASYAVTENIEVTVGVDNLLDKQPPVVGDTAGTTAYNSGNTFPSSYDVLGTIYKAGLKLRF
ncbi:TonB-dependent receptor [Shewanella corallii]|uniref:TonB-dependent receptor n=1 Tax=Shewanella corallii TaxID=560080 RepID=A0ABT0N3B0_9GAMM|nr:TonB-dependent receptor [Shewanella corallii]MCL2912941.1 TonB-dependent receptor [Shewanella corallii]